MTSGPERVDICEQLLRDADDYMLTSPERAVLIAEAQVNATLALVAAIASGNYGDTQENRDTWYRTFN